MGRSMKPSKGRTPMEGSPANSEGVVHYSGWRPRANEAGMAPVSALGLEPATFFSHYISQRKPVVLKDYPFGALAQWSDVGYLRAHAASAKVQVEERGSEGEVFAARHYRQTTFSEFLDHWSAGDPLMYLTTEAMTCDQQGRLSVLSSPVDKLVKDVHIHPDLMGSLVLANVNLWMGNSQAGASSGLHHDYHDNLYLLLRGKKHFKLYSPGEAQTMYTNGALTRVHPNGRINYKGHITRADGADASVLLRVTTTEQQAAMEGLELAEDQGDSKAVKAAEKQLDRAMDACLSADALHNSPGSRITCAKVRALAVQMLTSRPRHTPGNGSLQLLLSTNLQEWSRKCERERAAAEEEGQGCSDLAPHFSSARTTYGPLDNFPKLKEAPSLSVTLKAGEVLYLPAGWFHEVTSYNDENEVARPGKKQKKATSKDTAQGGHIAVNYWFHPPDNADFKVPYKSDLLERDWKAWLRLEGNTLGIHH